MRAAENTSPAPDHHHGKLNWPTILFLVISPIVAGAGVFWWVASGQFNAWTVVFAVVMAYATGLGITAGYHRLYSHKSYEAAWPVRLFLLIFGGASFEGSAWEWSLDHRDHHRHIDGDRDPYNINKGFWYAHILWLFYKNPDKHDIQKGQDLWKDPMIRFQHRFYVPLAVFFSFFFPMGIAALWGDPWGGLLVAGALRLVLNQHFTFAINSVCHVFGHQTYSDSHSARDNWFTALFTYGEGYHNYHHEFPSDYRNGIRYFHWDPTKWLIRGLSFVGLTSNLRRVDAETILLKKQEMREKHLAQKLARDPGLAEQAEKLLDATRARLNSAAEELRQLRKQYHAMVKHGQDRSEESIRELRQRLAHALRDLKQTMAHWEQQASQVYQLVGAQA